MNDIVEKASSWFASRGWQPLGFQRATWETYARGESGLLHMPTGAGKTYAAYLGPLLEAAAHPAAGMQILYITPLRALSRDIEKALLLPAQEMELDLRVESRTGDTPSHVRARQKKKRPQVLVTTPESLALLLSYETARDDFDDLRAVIVDEWHELLSTKRGSLLELSLARVRKWCPRARIWALSATLANTEQAARVATGRDRPTIVTAPMELAIFIESILPASVDSFPWAGHLGFNLLPKVLESLSTDRSTLLFTNTRSQAERWYRAILEARPEWMEILALHHGSLDRLERERVENGLKDGSIRMAVCTSSLDLGIDLAPVQQVVQIGSPKGIARLIQRAGRSGHSPGTPCRLLFVPTHALELVEIAACREAVARREVEARAPLPKPLDVLAQHLVSCALGGGFTRGEILEEIRTAVSYRDLTEEELEWTLALVRDGGKTLRAYPNYHKVVEEDGVYRVPNRIIARQHRLNIGTITSDASMLVRFMKGKVLGSIEESYITRLKRGDVFLFAGRQLELVMVRDLVAYVRKASGRASQTPRWLGGRLPLSVSLSRALRRTLEEASRGRLGSEELRRAAPLLEMQAEVSRLPAAGETLAETCETREGAHLFLFPFAGRLVHEGLAALLAYRLSRTRPVTFSLSVNDYGLELLSPEPFPYAESLVPGLFDTRHLVEDTLASVNLSELARRQFREIARVAGLVIQNMPGAEKSSRQLQVSASLLYDVFQRYDPANLLLDQARREVLEQQFEQARLKEVLTSLARQPPAVVATARPSPLAFPLMVERIGARLSSESLLERIERMKRQWTRPTSRRRGHDSVVSP